jgi:RNA polymerase sigma-70 factor (ECF subfamily)
MNGANRTTPLNMQAKGRVVTRDKEKVSAARIGSSVAFTEFYALYSRRLYKTIISITKHSEDAEDALQETFLRAYLAFHTFEGRSSVYSWLTRIAINSALIILRKRRARLEAPFGAQQPDAQTESFSFEIRDSAPTPELVYDLHRRRVTLIRAIRDLDARLRNPIEMQITRESSMKEIGQVLKISEAAVKARLHRARLRLSVVCRES